MTSINTIVPFSCRKPVAKKASVSRRTDPFDRLFDNFFHTALTNFDPQSQSVSDFRVDLEISETESAYHVVADLPGMEDKDVTLNLSEGVLTIEGERTKADVSKDKNIHRSERRYGAFKRNLVLPSDVNEKKISATMKHGVLTIDIEKMPEEKPKSKTIPIKS